MVLHVEGKSNKVASCSVCMSVVSVRLCVPLAEWKHIICVAERRILRRGAH